MVRIGEYRRGPVTLSQVEYYPEMSEETLAFQGKIEFGGMRSTVRNDGRGGANMIFDDKLGRALEAYARALPDYVTDDGEKLPMGADFLVSLMLEEAITVYEFKRKRRLPR